MPAALVTDKEGRGATMEADARTVNYGLAGGYLDATKHVERATQTTLTEPCPSDIARMLREAEAWANGEWEA
jgi:hypothetical protein